MILSIVRRHGLIHDNYNVPIGNIHMKSPRCGVQSIKLLQLVVDLITVKDDRKNYIEPDTS